MKRIGRICQIIYCFVPLSALPSTYVFLVSYHVMRLAVLTVVGAAGKKGPKDVDSMSVSELKAFLDSMHVSHKGVLEKSELQERAKAAAEMLDAAE